MTHSVGFQPFVCSLWQEARHSSVIVMCLSVSPCPSFLLYLVKIWNPCFKGGLLSSLLFKTHKTTPSLVGAPTGLGSLPADTVDSPSFPIDIDWYAVELRLK